MPRPRSRPLFELGGQWIAAEPGRRALYRYWDDAETGRTRRASLGTTDLERAKEALAAIYVRGAPKRADDHLSVVLEKYFEERTDGKPSEKQTRNAGRVLLKCWGAGIRVCDIDDARQKLFGEWIIAQGWRLSYAARNLGVLASALRHADLPAKKIVVNENDMRERWKLQGLAPERIFIPNDRELARVLSAPMPEKLFRWLIIQLTTGGRPQTAVDLSPAQRDRGARLVHLNPPARVQNKKYRATVRECRTLRNWLDSWEQVGLDAFGGRYCGYETIEGVKSALQDLRDRDGVKLPLLSTYSFRHKVTTVLRQAQVPEDQVALMLGHRRPDLRTTAGYGEWDPRYLADAANAIDAWFERLQKMMTRRIAPTRRQSIHNQSKNAA